MGLTTTASSNALATTEVGRQLIEQVTEQSVAARVLGPIVTADTEFAMPVMTQAPTSGWFSELDKIDESDAVIPSVSVKPARLSSLTTLSLELVQDNDVSQRLVTTGMVYDLARQLDKAVFSSVAAPAPDGLADLTDAQTFEATAAEWTTLDPFIRGASLVEQETAQVTAWVANPADVAAILALKTSDASHAYVLSNDPSSPTRRSIFGVPLYSQADVAQGTVYGVDNSRSFLVMRNDATVDASRESAFSKYAVQLRGTLRAAPIFPHAASVVKVQLSTAS